MVNNSRDVVYARAARTLQLGSTATAKDMIAWPPQALTHSGSSLHPLLSMFMHTGSGEGALSVMAHACQLDIDCETALPSDGV